jgi:hypothetical protein
VSRVFISEQTGAGIYVFSDDHCPAHIHARHRGEGWIARISFSYVSAALELISLAPMKNIPLQRVVNRLLSDVQERLPDCRRSWWLMRGTTCWANQWTPFGRIRRDHASLAANSECKQVADAQYDPENEQLHVVFHDGSTVEVELR